MFGRRSIQSGGVARPFHTRSMRSPRALPDRRLSTQTGKVILARTLTESYPVWLKKRTLRMLKGRQSSPRLRQTCQRLSLPSRVRAVAATTRKRAARLPFCRAHVLHVPSARQNGCGLSFDKLRTGLDEPPDSTKIATDPLFEHSLEVRLWGVPIGLRNLPQGSSPPWILWCKCRNHNAFLIGN